MDCGDFSPPSTRRRVGSLLRPPPAVARPPHFPCSVSPQAGVNGKNTMQDDAALLRRYAEDHSEEAFTELVNRHLGLVYHAALRQCGGDHHRAEEVAQLVFTDLARKAAALSDRPLLVAWLHTGTRYAASHLHRAEARRHAREHAAFAMNDTEAALAPESDVDWHRLRPLIDDALQSLGDRDRAAVLLRFFENRSYAELAATLSVTEDAARVRVNRAIEKLRSALARRGLVSTASALALALAQPALAAPPAGLAAHIAASSLAAATFVGASTGLVSAAFVGTAKIVAATAVAVTLLSLGAAVSQRSSSASHASASTPTPPTALSAADLAAILHPARLPPADAAEALAAYLALPPLPADATQADFLDRASRLRALLTILPAEHVAQLLSATASRAGDPEARLRRRAFTAWTELDAPAAARWAAMLSPSPAIGERETGLLLREAVLAWGRDDFSAACAWARSLVSPASGEKLVGDLFGQLASTEPTRALELARAGGDAFFRTHLAAVFVGWSKQEPAAALRALGAELAEIPQTTSNHLNWHVSQAFQAWAGTDPSAALDWMLARMAEDDATKQPLINPHAWLGPESPAIITAAFHRLAERFDLPRRSEVMQKLVGALALSDASAAASLLATLPDAAQRADLVEQTLATTSLSPDDALALARVLPPGEAREVRLAEKLAQIAQQDPDAVLAWLDRHAATPELATARLRVEGALLAHLATLDPVAAQTRWGAFPEGADKNRAAVDLAVGWSEKDPASATRWLGARIVSAHDSAADQAPAASGSVDLFDALQRLQAGWAHADPLALLDWAAENQPKLPHLPLLRMASVAVSSMYGPSYYNEGRDPPPRAERAATLARIPDPTLREELLAKHLRSWTDADPGAARAWIETHASLAPALP